MLILFIVVVVVDNVIDIAVACILDDVAAFVVGVKGSVIDVVFLRYC